ncbi:hypothetical protein CC85DRAFT_246669 [Cutaneotrichosporon oleaginosum]|uniref:Rad52/22 double-strand break repair protein n=1 Tax=Cutaneotrichosporon oleaginosum TaxID=879819 RepID=A0A0J1B315_9TREE|nr:uncharacterized protein CC85DRAFT_246669 [Cutaneotrichosporon oleaginosum]KLT41999.1 hypothetical protein CC85DRAFT_246669 [Cutaneotrichosporon oleaginosum]TXT14342.1 hypothetical protein COLE_00535 [Cutaneotrichosporon oleaginosum]
MPGSFTPWSEDKVATLQARLQKKLGPEYVTQRAGPGGGPKLSYIEGWKVINLANEVFGFNGWSSSITRLQTDFLDVDANERVKVGITAIIRITLKDGCYHEDLGYGHAENIRGKAMALEKAQKEAVTDGIKRALKHFGNVLGNCLYDREYTKEVQKMRVGPVSSFPGGADHSGQVEPRRARAPARVYSAGCNPSSTSDNGACDGFGSTAAHLRESEAVSPSPSRSWPCTTNQECSRGDAAALSGRVARPCIARRGPRVCVHGE